MKPTDDGTTGAPDLLTTSEVSCLLGVSPNTVTRWAREGRLPCRLTLGGHHRYEREAIEKIRESLRRGATAEAAVPVPVGGAH
jgi:excisionase family DNA binding protein